MFPDLLDSFVRPAAYRRFAGEKASRLAGYVAFLSLVFVGAIGISVKLRLAPMFTETFEWLETKMPAIQFSSGTVTSAAPGPLRLEHPRAKEVAVMIDTNRKDPVTAAQMEEQKVLAYLTGNALYLMRGQNQVETIDLSKAAPERPVTVDSGSYKEMESAFDWVFYPALLLFFFLSFAASLAVCGLVYSFVGWIILSARGGALSWGALFRVGVHAQTAGCLLYSLDSLLPVSIPLFQWASIALSLAFVWLGVKAATSAANPPAPAA